VDVECFGMFYVVFVRSFYLYVCVCSVDVSVVFVECVVLFFVDVEELYCYGC